MFLKIKKIQVIEDHIKKIEKKNNSNFFLMIIKIKIIYIKFFLNLIIQFSSLPIIH